MTNNAVQPTTPCAKCPLRALDIFRDRSPLDIHFVQDFKIGELTVAPGGAILHEQAMSSHLFTVLSGWAFRYKTLDDGRRQIINYALPGDFLGLQSSISEVMGHGVEALTDAILCVFPRDKLWALFNKDPQLAYDITWLAAREERTLDDQILSLGRRTALERTAYLLWYLFDTARGLDMVKRGRLDLPLRQTHLADTLGLSLVHTNKTLQRLRKMGLIDLDERSLKIIDEEELKTLSRAEVIPAATRPLI
jgi:CRP/FNR family transcriptional regulator, anaerobic regulatory protein